MIGHALVADRGRGGVGEEGGSTRFIFAYVNEKERERFGGEKKKKMFNSQSMKNMFLFLSYYMKCGRNVYFFTIIKLNRVLKNFLRSTADRYLLSVFRDLFYIKKLFLSIRQGRKEEHRGCRG